MALTSYNRLYAWGSNEKHQLGLGLSLGLASDQAEPTYVDTPTLVTLSDRAGADANVIKVVAGLNHSAVLTQAGRVYTWGANEYGQLGIDASKDFSTGVPQLVTGLSRVIDISEGARTTTVRVNRYDGMLWGWGNNNDGQQNTNSGQETYTSPRISKIDFSGIKRIKLDKDGNRIQAKDKEGNPLFEADGTTPVYEYETGLPKNTFLIKVVDNDTSSMAMLTNGAVITWGTNAFNELGAGEDDPDPVKAAANAAALKERLVQTSTGMDDGIYKPGYVVGLEGDYTFSTRVLNDKGVYQNVPDQVLVYDVATNKGVNVDTLPGKVDIDHIVAVSAGATHDMALNGDQTVYTWGANNYFQLVSPKAAETVWTAVPPSRCPPPK